MTRREQLVDDLARKESYHHGDLRRALLDATLRLVHDRGLHGFSVRAAARVVGVTPGAAFYYFASKEALLAGLAEEGFGRFRDVLLAASREPARSASEQSRNVAVAYVLFAVEHPTLFRVMVGLGVGLRRGNLGVLALGTYRLVRSVVLEGMRAEWGRSIPDAEVLGWWSIVHGRAFLAIDGHLLPDGHAPDDRDAQASVVEAAIDRVTRAGRGHRPASRRSFQRRHARRRGAALDSGRWAHSRPLQAPARRRSLHSTWSACRKDRPGHLRLHWPHPWRRLRLRARGPHRLNRRYCAPPHRRGTEPRRPSRRRLPTEPVPADRCRLRRRAPDPVLPPSSAPGRPPSVAGLRPRRPEVPIPPHAAAPSRTTQQLRRRARRLDVRLRVMDHLQPDREAEGPSPMWKAGAGARGSPAASPNACNMARCASF